MKLRLEQIECSNFKERLRESPMTDTALKPISEQQMNTTKTPSSIAPPVASNSPSRLRIGKRYQPSRLANNYDAIVIGSGIGGLTTAALLSQMGKKVLVLEQHYTAGGFTHAYERNGYEWDVGVHYIGEMGSGGVAGAGLAKKTFDFITAGELQWAAMDTNYDRIILGNETFNLIAGKENFTAC